MHVWVARGANDDHTLHNTTCISYVNQNCSVKDM